jgi:alkylation response protein AidB-like acyl-CoA dehydrogenase
MTDYRSPTTAIVQALDAVGLPDLLDLPAFTHVDRDLVTTLVAEFGRFADEVIVPTDAVGDRLGSVRDPATGAVATPEGFAEAYRRYVESGWGALPFPRQHGGGGLPRVVGLALQEILTSANMALSLNPVLTQSVIEGIIRLGTPEQQERYLPHLLTGDWNGTMLLTEPDAGSDVGAARTRAEPGPDGTWRVTGTKVFITWGEHDLTDNIVHLVLARTPGAPPGTAGLSLFLVPKRRVLGGGGLGEVNGVRCSSIEHKVGLHASPTCVLEFDEAVGELVGEVGDGMRLMFVVMNSARLSIGVQGLAAAEVTTQQARAYADERRQGRTAGTPPGQSARLVEHPDVRRMLLTMASTVSAMRLLLYTTAAQADRAAHHPDEAVRDRAQQRADLLTPIAKAWSTDQGLEVSSLAIQVHGGVGYVEETGVARHWRDVRVASIYEGTNGIQAIDLVLRKLPRSGGAVVRDLFGDLDAIGSELAAVGDERTDRVRAALAEALEAVRIATDWLIARAASAPDDARAGATTYLDMVGTTVAGALLAGAARRDGSPRAMAIAEFYASERLARVPGLVGPVTAGAARLAPI